MTGPTTGSPAAGWYPVSPGSSQLRWWDGTQWTEQFHSLQSGSGFGPGYADPEKAPDGTRPGTVWIWIFVLLPLLQLVELPLIATFYEKVFSVGLSNPTAMTQLELSPASGIVAIDGISLLLYAVLVVLAVLDYRALRARGVPRPFHWAWTFLSSTIYIIGRTVIVRRRIGAGMAPLWIYIVVVVASIVASVVVLVPIMTAAMSAALSTSG